jgi:hypothetical protein
LSTRSGVGDPPTCFGGGGTAAVPPKTQFSRRMTSWTPPPSVQTSFPSRRGDLARSSPRRSA